MVEGIQHGGDIKSVSEGQMCHTPGGGGTSVCGHTGTCRLSGSSL